MNQVEFTNRDNLHTGLDNSGSRHNSAPWNQELQELLILIESIPSKVSQIKNQHVHELQNLMTESRRALELHFLSKGQVESPQSNQPTEHTDFLLRKRTELHEVNASVKSLTSDIERLKKRLKIKRQSVPCLSSSVVESKRRLACLRNELIELVRKTKEPRSPPETSGIEVGTMTDQVHPKAIQIEKGKRLIRSLEGEISRTERALVAQLLDTLKLSQETD